MRVNVYLSGNRVHDMVLTSFHRGIPSEHDALIGNVEHYEPSDVAVVFGVYKKAVPASFARGEVIAKHRVNGNRVVVLETGYVSRGETRAHHFAAGLNNINGWADFRNKHVASDRWEKLGVEMKPFRPEEKDSTKPYLLCGQVPWDASVQYVDMLMWLEETAAKIRHFSGRQVVFRPHPRAAVHPKKVTGCMTSYKPFEEDLDDAYQVVTYNSNAAVEAVIAGVPSAAYGMGTMAWDVTSRSVEGPLWRGNRQPWAERLAYTQWTCPEMEDGLTWTHLFH